MKKVLKYFAMFIGVMVVLILGIVLFIGIKGIPVYAVNLPQYKSEVKSHSVERGQKLVTMLCAGCHLNRETGVLSGGRMKDAPPEFGDIYASNITQDQEYGIGSWSDAEIVYLLRTGIKRDGSYAPPYMAKLPKMSDDDINSIIVFLKSDHQMVKPANIPDQPCEPSILTKALSQGVFVPFEYPSSPIPNPDNNNPIELGEYLAVNLECFSCHSSDFKTNNFLNPEKSEGYFGGGNKPLNMDGKVMPTPNLTPDKESGIGNWTSEQFVQALRFGTLVDDKPLQYPMQPYSNLTEYEAEAIFEYLKTIPAIKNKVQRGPL